MTTRKPVPLKTLFSRDGSALERLARQAAAGDRLCRQVLGLLPPDLTGHLTAAVAREDTLVLFVDSAVWAPRFRFLDRELRLALAEKFDLGFARLAVKVRPRTE